jgi:hypothetical protein
MAAAMIAPPFRANLVPMFSHQQFHPAKRGLAQKLVN